MLDRRDLFFVLAVALGVTACESNRVEDETPPPDDVDMQSDTMGLRDTLDMPGDTLGVDTMSMDRSPAPGESPSAGGTTVNFESGTATTADGRETPVGGVTSGSVTTREGAAATEDSSR